MKLITASLKYFRGITDKTFTPAIDGITAIVGENGTGKTSILAGISWCLYGEKPEGVKRADALINEKADYKAGDRTQVTCVVSVSDGRLLRVNRRITTRKGATEVDMWQRPAADYDGTNGGALLADADGWEHVAGPAVSHANPVIVRALGMDSRQYFAAVHVQQKQVDDLVHDKKRGEVIEQQTGITALTVARDKAREEVNALKRSSRDLHVDKRAVKEAEKAAKDAKADVEKLRSRVAKGESKTRDARDRYEKARATFEEKSAAYTAGQERRARKAALAERIDSAKTRISALEAEKRELMGRVGAHTGGVTVEDAKNSLASARDALDAARDRERAASALVEEARAAGERLQAALTSGDGEALTEETLMEIVSSLSADVEKLQREFDALRDRCVAARADRDRLTRASDMLRGNSGDAHVCPTCQQDVEDAKALADSLALQAQEANEKSEKLEAEGARVRDALNAAVTRLEAARARLATVGECAPVAALLVEREKALADATETVREQGVAVEAADMVLSSAVEYQGVRGQLDRVAGEIRSLLSSIGDADAELAALPKGERLVSGETVDNARERMLSHQATLSEYEGLLAQLRVDEANASGALSVRESELAGVRDRMSRYGEALAAVEVASAALAVVEEYRAERIRTGVPLVAEAASRFLAACTDGAFTGLSLDEKYNVSVTTAEGVQRDCGVLSGGELSAAAMALRMGLAEVAGGGGMMVLDEVLVSQDAARAELMLQAVKSMSAGQVVMVAHSPVVLDVADAIVEM
jgi:DNA repair exonuclease SbcCD ATPase subunit